MTSQIRHRGPDGEGYVFFNTADNSFFTRSGQDTPTASSDAALPSWFPEKRLSEGSLDAHIGFAHRRLSILDLSPLGHQPMSYADDRYWITYNGEVFNYLELKAELESLGHVFLSRSDTEVILASYSQWGADCLSKFNGMWAFAIYDRLENKIFLARDRFGVKPLYYWFSPNGDFYFASEIKQFMSLLGWSSTLNHQRAYDFLVWGITDHTDETLFKDVFHLRPGHYVEMSCASVPRDHSGRVSLVQWYEIPRRKFNGSFAEASGEFSVLLQDAVKLRLRSDVPVGSCLSGGLDSSSIVCLMSNFLNVINRKNALNTFSSLSKVEKINEERWVDAVIEQTGARSHHVYPDLDELFDIDQKITWHQDEPFGSASIFAQWKVFELASNSDVRVVLDGQGADEQLFGYHFTFGVRFASLFRSGRWLRLLKEVFLFRKTHGYSYPWIFMRFLGSLLPRGGRNYLRSFSKSMTPNPDWLNLNWRVINKRSPADIVERSVNDCCRSQMTSTNLQMLLHWEDRDSMAHSIESRVPFLDYRLVEFSMSLPDDYKTSDAITKRILRSAMSGIIPNKIRDRVDKIGFAAPEEIWLRETNPDLFRKKMQDSIVASQGVLNERCMDVLEDVISGRRPFNFVIWRMINFGQWMKIFSVDAVEKST